MFFDEIKLLVIIIFSSFAFMYIDKYTTMYYLKNFDNLKNSSLYSLYDTSTAGFSKSYVSSAGSIWLIAPFERLGS
jgi:hypothetical protein